MGKMKAEAMGDTAPSRAAYLDVGRFRLIRPLTNSDRVWITDRETGEGGLFDEAKLAAVLLRFWGEEF